MVLDLPPASLFAVILTVPIEAKIFTVCFFFPLFFCFADENFVCFTRHEPMGVCGAITPVSNSNGALGNGGSVCVLPYLVLQPFDS